MIPYIPARTLKALKIAVAFVCIYIFFFTSFLHWPDSAGPRLAPRRISSYSCPSLSRGDTYSHIHSFSFNDTSLTESRILLLLENVYSRHGRLITQMLNATKCSYKIETFSKDLPLLTASSLGRYSAIVIENFNRYVNLPKSNRRLLDKYSQEYKVPIISFVPGRAEYFASSKVRGMNLTIWHNQKANNIRFPSSSMIPFVARPEVVLPNPLSDGKEWTLFDESPSFESVMVAEDAQGKRRAAIVRDRGVTDGVEKILIGHNLTEWIVGLGFLDSLRWSTKGRCGIATLDRFIQIDMDDVFVGARGTRMVANDVVDLIQSQDSLRSRILNFSYLLGYSGAYFLHGDNEEDEGDRMLIKKASNFYWFPHMWKHNHAQDHNESFLESTMILNKQFALDNNLNVPFDYAISPQHAGVYPVHLPLYEAWEKVWKVKTTSTEEYPHLRPWSNRKGFIHRGIKVLPRQTCGLYTHTQFFHLYPGGVNKLISLIEGGDLFWTVVLNPISIFMTHQQNFAHDQLGPYTFDSLLSFLQCWTQLQFKWEDPISLADRYFSLFPSEKSPLWSNPCSDDRHRSILSPKFNCTNLTLPNVLIVGPQKTGTTALESFLEMHPGVGKNGMVEGSFEEVQFFSGENYAKGFEWYAGLFPNASVVMEKSATYFDSVVAAERAATLIPHARIIVILHDPIQRAYSWYNHLVARNETIVAGLSMDDVLDGVSASAKKIRSRCISGGRYAHHLDRWLQLFPSTQLYLIDGGAFKDHPSQVMSDLTEWLELPYFDYESSIKFSRKKGFYCKFISGRSSCLGSSKGRIYPTLSPSLSSRLCSVFRNDNIALEAMLRKHRFPIPSWLPPLLDRCQ
ncbi:hypothetical protein PFISCL1PPCAC_15553 [Pristionchus fissidentatus]|uniref:[heparan sulfate]-glucosamine N-sulfotransferase n=1 Tax=Pristionchus fissidentatus TaxID=1538716 RepID=A0AAV5VWT4_9BILA|nr:hypothetical protein PFISCL1PPCAC_15553 [Pristionchus fissidentatus]